MVLSREEKEKRVLELYYDKDYTYREIAKELRMSPNQISAIIKRHEEKNDAIANKKKMLSLSSQAYKLFSEGKTNVQVAIKLDLPQEKITQFHMEYWRLKNQDKFESLYMLTKGKISVLWKIYKELMIIGGLSIEEVASMMSTGFPYQLSSLYKELVRKRGLSIEEVAAVVDINLNVLPEMKEELDQTRKEIAKKQVDLDMIKIRISSLEEEEIRRKNGIVTLPPSSYRYVDNPAMNQFPYHSDPAPRPSSLPYWPSRKRDP